MKINPLTASVPENVVVTGDNIVNKVGPVDYVAVKGDDTINGKYYLEIVVTGSMDVQVGFVVDSLLLTHTGPYLDTWAGIPNSVAAYYALTNPDRLYTGSAYVSETTAAVSGDVIMIAIDTVTGEAWAGVNGVWGYDRPPSTAAHRTGLITGDWSVFANIQGNDTTVDFKFGAENLTYPLPIGYNAVPLTLVATISGDVREGDGNFVSRRVLAIEQSTGMLKDETVSDVSGNFELKVDPLVDYMVICIDDEPNPKNALIFDRVNVSL